MACDDEKKILDEEQKNYDDAKAEFDRAQESREASQWEFNTAGANLTNCADDCGAELSRFEQAADRLGRADGHFFDSKAGLDEAGDWLDIATDLYCECKNAEQPED